MQVWLLSVIVILLCYRIVCCRRKEGFRPRLNPICRKQYRTVDRSKYLKIKHAEYALALNKAKSALDRLAIPFFLSSGTCLGYFREGKFIDHDYDIDLGIFAEDYTPLIKKFMEAEGFTHYRTLGHRDTGLELSFRLNESKLRHKTKIDIFLHYRNGGNISWYSYVHPEFNDRVHYRVSNFDIKPVFFMGMVVNAPFPTLKYIEQHYGPDWMIPKKPGKGPGRGYVYHKSPTSIVS